MDPDDVLFAVFAVTLAQSCIRRSISTIVHRHEGQNLRKLVNRTTKNSTKDRRQYWRNIDEYPPCMGCDKPSIYSYCTSCDNAALMKEMAPFAKIAETFADDAEDAAARGAIRRTEQAHQRVAKVHDRMDMIYHSNVKRQDARRRDTRGNAYLIPKLTDNRLYNRVSATYARVSTAMARAQTALANATTTRRALHLRTMRRHTNVCKNCMNVVVPNRSIVDQNGWCKLCCRNSARTL